MIEINKIHHTDCLEGMKQIKDNSVDMILCDLPYGMTNCKWDSRIDMISVWTHYRRIIKEKGAIVLTASQPFTTDLINSARDIFRYCLVWSKNTQSSSFLKNKRPLKYHEDIVVFYKNQPTYNPQMEKRKSISSQQRYKYKLRSRTGGEHYKEVSEQDNKYDENLKYPSSVLNFKVPPLHKGRLHPTQKPVELFEYLIKTYTNKGDLILDNCMGSGTTAVACKRTGRNFIGFEIEKKYVDIAIKRLRDSESDE